MSGINQSEVASLLRDILQQQTAMLQLQRALVEQLLDVPAEEQPVLTEPPVTSPANVPVPPDRLAPADDAPRENTDPSPARGARYYQPRSAPVTESIPPEDVELMRRLQEMRDASDLILQFGPQKGSTLAQVAISNPEYIRELMMRAKRPEVRAAAGRLVEALDAAAEHKRQTTRTPARRGGHIATRVQPVQR